MPAILAAIAGWLAQFLGSTALRWIAFKAAMIFLFVTVLPIVLNNLIYKLLNIFMTMASDQASTYGSGTSLVYEFTGVGAYIASRIGLPEAFAITISAVAISATLRIFRLN